MTVIASAPEAPTPLRPGPATIAAVLAARPSDQPIPIWADHLTQCPPAYATARDWNYPTMGPIVAALAVLLTKDRRNGINLMPWQRYVLDVSLEYELVEVTIRNADGVKTIKVPLFRYRTIIGTVPRQSGKTTMALPLIVHRSIGIPEYAPAPWGGPQTLIYTAQDRLRARRKWVREHVPTIKNSKALSGLYSTRLTNGDEAVEWDNTSFYAIESTTAKAGHGDSLDFSFNDEAFAHVDGRLDQAQVPAMSTRPNAQQWVWSTMGDDASVWLNEKVALGRSAVVSGNSSLKVAYFEWSAPPGAELDDPDIWPLFHPAIGFTQTAETLMADAAKLKPAEARRAYFNWRKTGGGEPAVIDPGRWYASRVELSEVDIVGKIGLGVDISPDRSAVYIAWAGQTTDGQTHVELDAIPLNDPLDAPPRLRDIYDRNPDLMLPAIGVNPAGASGSMVRLLELVDLRVLSMSARAMAAACTLVLDLLNSGRLSHTGQAELDDAVKITIKRPLGESFAWKARDLDQSDPFDRDLPNHASALYAVTLAVAVLNADHKPAKPPPAAVARIIE